MPSGQDDEPSKSEPRVQLGEGHERVRAVREGLADLAVVGFAAGLVVATPVALSRARDVGWGPPMSGLVAVTLALWTVAALRRRIPFAAKATTVVGAGLVLAVLETFSLGLASFGVPLLVLSAALAVALFGTRAGIACSAFGTACLAVAGYGYATGLLVERVDVALLVHAPSSWLTAVVGYALAVGVAVATIGRHQRELGELVSELEARSDSLRRQAREDELTGLANRREFFTRARTEMERIRRYGDPGFLAILDLDHFKRVNDVHGHGAGDEVLRAFAAMLTEESRTPDHPARLGGEEFALLMPSTGEHGAVTVLERIRERWAAAPTVVDGEPVESTVSIGLTEIRPDDGSIDVTIRRADAALYAAKDGGRNRVVFEP